MTTSTFTRCGALPPRRDFGPCELVLGHGGAHLHQPIPHREEIDQDVIAHSTTLDAIRDAQFRLKSLEGDLAKELLYWRGQLDAARDALAKAKAEIADWKAKALEHAHDAGAFDSLAREGQRFYDVVVTAYDALREQSGPDGRQRARDILKDALTLESISGHVRDGSAAKTAPVDETALAATQRCVALEGRIAELMGEIATAKESQKLSAKLKNEALEARDREWTRADTLADEGRRLAKENAELRTIAHGFMVRIGGGVDRDHPIIKELTERLARVESAPTSTNEAAPAAKGPNE